MNINNCLDLYKIFYLSPNDNKIYYSSNLPFGDKLDKSFLKEMNRMYKQYKKAVKLIVKANKKVANEKYDIFDIVGFKQNNKNKTVVEHVFSLIDRRKKLDFVEDFKYNYMLFYFKQIKEFK